MIENDLLDSKIVQYLDFPYFVHYIPEDELKRTIYDVRYYFSYDYDKFSANNWELHKKYIKEGHNPNEIAKIIRNDDIEKLQEISSQTNFDFNQYIEPSLYERCSFVNNSAALIYNSKNVTLIDYAAFFGSVKCFKYLLMNGSELENTGKYAIAGGNEEIIHLCEQNNSSFEGAYKAAIKFHKNDLFKYIYENKLEELYENYQNITFYNLNVCTLVELGKICILYDNYEIFSYLQDIGMKIDKFLINVTVKIGNLYLVKYLLKKMQIPKNILIFVVESKNIEIVKYVLDQEGIDINAKNDYGQTALILASENGYTEIVKLLLEQEGIDINAKDNYGQTALMYASENGYTEIVKLLLEQEGIDINTKNNDLFEFIIWELYKTLYTALILAISNSKLEIVKLLIEQEGIDTNGFDNYGKTILIFSSEKGYFEIAKLILKEKRFDINAKDKDGYTALMYASNCGHAEIVKLLLE